MAESIFLAPFLKHNKPAFKKVACFGMDKPVTLSTKKVFIRMCLGVVFTLIDFTCGYPVAKHFGNVANRHFNRADLSFHRVIVCPIFEMMLVSAFVMKPCCTVAFFASLGFIGAMGAAVIFCPLPKFYGRILYFFSVNS